MPQLANDGADLVEFNQMRKGEYISIEAKSELEEWGENWGSAA